MPNPPQPPPWSQQQPYCGQYTSGYPNAQYSDLNYPSPAQFPVAVPPPAYPTWNQANYPVVPYPGIRSATLSHAELPLKQPKMEFRCDSCDLTLDSEIAHSAHIQSHTSCNLCDYVASPKLVKAHYQSVHGKFSGTGFKSVTIAIPGCPVQRFKICVGDHPEDISKWIAERRKRFPRRQPPKEANEEAPTILGNLLDGYGSSSSEEEAQATETKNEWESRTTNNDTEEKAFTNKPFSNHKTRICRYFQRNGTCHNGDNCNFSHEIEQHLTKQKREPDNRRQQTKTKTSSTLLRKLLKTDEDRENVLTLQLLRYIMDCNYLQEQREQK